MASTKTHVGATAVEMTAEDRKISDANCAAAAEVRNAHIAKECDREFERSNTIRRMRGQDPQSRAEFLADRPEYAPSSKHSPAFAAEQDSVTFGGAGAAKKKRASSSGAKKRTAKK